MTLTIGAAVRVQDAYCDAAHKVPVTGTVEDIFDYEGVRRYVVMLDEATIKAGHENGMRAVPPGGEFSIDRLEAVNPEGLRH